MIQIINISDEHFELLKNIKELKILDFEHLEYINYIIWDDNWEFIQAQESRWSLNKLINNYNKRWKH